MNNSENHNKGFLAGLIAGLLGAIVLASAFFMARNVVSSVILQKNGNSGSSDVINDTTREKVSLIEKTIDKYFMGNIDKTAETDGIYKGIVTSLDDPYSQYYTVSELNAMVEDDSGKYAGIGCYIAYDEDMKACYISGVMDGSPAAAAGIKTGDIFYKVNGEVVRGKSSSDISEIVRGEEGTTVDLVMYRDGSQVSFTITRATVDNPTVSVNMADKDAGIGYLRISEFNRNTDEQFTEGLKKLNDEGMKAMILDVRENPGGDLDTVVNIANEMLPKGKIVYMVDKNGEETDYNADGKNEFKKPLVVLCDGNSASAAEILTGSIKDRGIGTIVGEKTFGKGIVQSVIPFKDGSAVKLTIAKYYLPNGECIHGQGIEPDVEVKLDEAAYEKDGTDNQMQKAIEILKKEL